MKEVNLLRENILYIIKANPSVCTLIRNKEIKNVEGEIVNYNRIEKEGIIVRIAVLDERQRKESLSNFEIAKKTYSLTASYDEDIREGDALKLDDGSIFKVVDMECFYYGGRDGTHCYKKSGLIEEVQN